MSTSATGATPEPSNYQPAAVARYFDEYGVREWDRLIQTPVDEVSLHIHAHYLAQHIARGQRALEIGAGAGRFTQILASLGAQVLVADLSPGQLELNRRFGLEHGFAQAVVDWQQVDICDLSRVESAAFDAVVAYGGPFSYVVDRRDVALRECLRVLQPGGMILLSVMSLWGTAHANLGGVMELPALANQKITSTGDLTPATHPERKGSPMHMFRAQELRAWLEQAGTTVVAMSASGCLAVGWNDTLRQIRGDNDKWHELLRMEVAACAEPGCLDMGTHLIAVARKE